MCIIQNQIRYRCYKRKSVGTYPVHLKMCVLFSLRAHTWKIVRVCGVCVRCASVCMGILSVPAFGTNVQVCACMCEHEIVRFCACCYVIVVYYCMYVCNRVHFHEQCRRAWRVHSSLTNHSSPLRLGLTRVFSAYLSSFFCFSLILY